MSRYVAFLRAINVGGHTVRMEQLRDLFESMKFDTVETFIASGNVIFETRASGVATLERKIESTLHKALGYEVATFIRTVPELERVAVHEPVVQNGKYTDYKSIYVTFTHSEPEASVVARLMEHRSHIDEFHVNGREVFWLVRTRSTDSKFTGARLEKLLGGPATARNVNTVQRIVEKYAK